eukprot:gene14224-21811_t
MKRCAPLLANPMHMPGYPVDGGKQGYLGQHGMPNGGVQRQRFQNRIGDAIDWNIVAPEWYWERGGYEPMGNMPEQWKKDGFGLFLTSLSDQDLEMLVYDLLHDIVLEENLRDGLELRAPHPDTNEPLYSKIPSWVFSSQGWSRPDLRERIFERVCQSFRIVPPYHQRMQITHPTELVSWVVARVSFARTRPAHQVPKQVKRFLDAQPRQPELGFTLALPDKERTSLRQAMKALRMTEIDADYTFTPAREGESDAGKQTMYWLELERNRRIERERQQQRTATRQDLVAARAARRAAAASAA